MSYPQAVPPVGAPAPVTAPQSTKYAVWLMYLGALLNAIGTIIGLTQKDSVMRQARRELIEQNDSAIDIDKTMDIVSSTYTVTVLLIGVLGTLLWLWMAWANGKGRGWARILATVLFGLHTLALLGALFGATKNSAGSNIISVLTWLAGLGAIIFLWRRDHTEYIERRSATTA